MDFRVLGVSGFGFGDGILGFGDGILNHPPPKYRAASTPTRAQNSRPMGSNTSVPCRKNQQPPLHQSLSQIGRAHV